MGWTHRISVLSFLGVMLLSGSRIASAQCDGNKRAPTPLEAKTYADGYALFQRMAPPTPEGWTATDSREDRVITFVCAAPTDIFTTWGFSRTFNRSNAEMQARGEAAQRKTDAAMAQAEERGKAKAAKLADLERRQEDLAKRIAALAEKQNFAALAPLSEQNEKLAAEREALSKDSELDAAMNAIGAEVGRDSTATFTLTVGATDVEMSSAYKPMPSAAGKGYRQDAPDNTGNPTAELVIVLPPAPGVPGQNLVRIIGDPARADALLKGTKLR